MRIIRFVADDGSVLYGHEHRGGSATIVRDMTGVLGSASTEAKLRWLKGKTAVVAEDDKNMRAMVCTVLERAGCTCIQCVDGAEAVEAVTGRAIDLVVSDIMMPHYNGYEVYSAARSRDATVPVLLITGFGYDPSHSLVRASAEGLQSVLYKPFTPQQLIEELLKAVEVGNGSAKRQLEPTDRRVNVSTVLTPLRPSNLLAVGRNYRDSRQPNLEAPLDDATLEVFMKPTTALQAHGQPIELPRFDGVDPQVDCEGELAVVIGATARDVDEADAASLILGYTIANDVTARRWQTDGGPPLWMRGKGFDTFCPLGPTLVTADSLLNPNDLTITTTVNGRVWRQGSTSMMIRSVPRLISDLSRRITLEPGTVVLTGSPPSERAASDLSFLKPGDEVAVEISPIGRLVNPVAEPD